MFCPGCGFEEQQRSQFCRACGADLRPARTGLEKAELMTSVNASARDEIGRALATKIRELQKAKDLEILVESILPEVEKFLESPEERRLRRLRAGVITSAIGAAAMACVFLTALFASEKAILPFMGIGLVVFLIGLGVILNGFFFSLPHKRLSGPSPGSVDKLINKLPANPRAATQLPSPTITPSVTEHTTHHLSDEAPAVPRVLND